MQEEQVIETGTEEKQTAETATQDEKTNGEKELVRCIYKSKDGNAAAIKSLMNNPAVYPVYRNRLINKHLVDGSTRGYLRIRLPLFDKYIEVWGD